MRSTASRGQFSEEELVKLTIAIVAINGANRINIGFRAVPGSYRAGTRGQIAAPGKRES